MYHIKVLKETPSTKPVTLTSRIFLQVAEHEINEGYQVIQYKNGISSITPKATTVGLYQKFNTVRTTRDQPERISIPSRRSENMTYTQPTK